MVVVWLRPSVKSITTPRTRSGLEERLLAVRCSQVGGLLRPTSITRSRHALVISLLFTILNRFPHRLGSISRCRSFEFAPRNHREIFRLMYRSWRDVYLFALSCYKMNSFRKQISGIIIINNANVLERFSDEKGFASPSVYNYLSLLELIKDISIIFFS